MGRRRQVSGDGGGCVVSFIASEIWGGEQSLGLQAGGLNAAPELNILTWLLVPLNSQFLEHRQQGRSLYNT